MAEHAVLIINTPEHSGNLLYATGYFCIDTVVYLNVGGETYGFFPATEFEHARQTAKVAHVCDMTFSLRMSEQSGDNPKKVKSGCVLDILRDCRVTAIDVPEDFPIVEADFLRNKGFTLNAVSEPFFKTRSVKTEDEQNHIRQNSLINAQVMDKVYQILAASTVDDADILVYKGQRLTSEALQNMITAEFVANRLWSDASIVAVGDQAVMPHEHGSGYIYAGRSIVVDIFPRSLDNYYFSDMTRTFCKHRASDELVKLYDTVREAQLRTLDTLKSGESGRELHQWIADFFADKGYQTGISGGFLQGFFHGTGHGVGLECHEYPYISQNGSFLRKGQTVTVEPGLYYKNIGGVRIEDLVIVTDDGPDILTAYPKKLIVE